MGRISRQDLASTISISTRWPAGTVSTPPLTASVAVSWNCGQALEAEEVVRPCTECHCEERSLSEGRSCGRQRASPPEFLLQLHASSMYLLSRAWPGNTNNYLVGNMAESCGLCGLGALRAAMAAPCV